MQCTEARTATKKIEIPKTVEELREADNGIKHICGLIIRVVENSPVFTKKSIRRIYFEYPETFLHPAQQRYLVGLIQELMKLYGEGGKTIPDVEMGVIEDT